MFSFTELRKLAFDIIGGNFFLQKICGTYVLKLVVYCALFDSARAKLCLFLNNSVHVRILYRS